MEPLEKNLQITSNLKYVESDKAPDTSKLGKGEAAFGVVGGIPSFYGNSDGQKVQEYLGHLVSLRFAHAIASSADLNSLTEAGNYVCQTEVIAQSVTNRPAGVTSYFRLFVTDFANNGTVFGQLLLDFSTGKQFYRYRSAQGQWGAWAEEVLATDLEAARSTLDAAITINRGLIDEIKALIPKEASEDNQLSDKTYVQDTVRKSASRYIVPTQDEDADKFWEDLSSLQSATKWYSAGKEITELTQNDYATVEVQREGIAQREFWQAIYREADGAGVWDVQFKLGSYFTEAQQAALDSGVTAAWKQQVDKDIPALKDGKLDKQEGTDSKLRVYTVSTTGEQTVTKATDAADANTLALRDSAGRLKVATPVADSDATPKSYVDNKVTSDVSAAQSALEERISTEEKTARAAEQKNADAIAEEERRAKEEESKLQSAIGTAQSTFEEEIAQEKEDREAADTTLQGNIDTVVAESAVDIEASLDETNYTLTIELKAKNGSTLTTKTVNLPLGTLISGATYDKAGKKIVFTLQNGEKLEVDVSDLISGLATNAVFSGGTTSGLVPAPKSAGSTAYLRQDGSWAVPPDNNTWREVEIQGADGVSKGTLSNSTGSKKLIIKQGAGIETTFVDGVLTISAKVTENVTQLPASKIIFDSDIVLAGNYTSVGNISKGSDGTTYPAQGKTVAQLIEEIFTKKLQPTVTQPSARGLTFSPSGAVEVGTKYSSISVSGLSLDPGKYTYDASTGVTATGYSIKRVLNGTATEIATAASTTDTNGGAGFTIGDSTELCYRGAVKYSDGIVAHDNLGNASDPVKQIKSGTTSEYQTTSKLTGYRAYFYGTVKDASPLIGSAITSAKIRSLASSNKAYSSGTVTINVPIGTTAIYIACIATKTGVTRVMNTSNNSDITDVFTKQGSIKVEGAASYTAVDYNVWYYKPLSAFTAAATLVVTLG